MFTPDNEQKGTNLFLFLEGNLFRKAIRLGLTDAQGVPKGATRPARKQYWVNQPMLHFYYIAAPLRIL
jgi:hypothetical protein